jgi:hypothetical protein
VQNESNCQPGTEISPPIKIKTAIVILKVYTLAAFLFQRCDFLPAATSALNSCDLLFAMVSDFQFAPA